MDWDKLRVFHAVAEAGSFTHAGESLNLSQSAVSRQISALEDSVGVPLFHRHARGLILTEQGEMLHKTAREVFAKLSMTEALLTESKDTPRGRLTVTTTTGMGAMWLAPRLKSFIDEYPEIEITLLLDDTELDLAMREADVAIRLVPPRQPDLIQRHLLTIRFHIYGSKSYLDAHGTPQTVEDLRNHRIILYPADSRVPIPTINWLMDSAGVLPQDHKAVFRVNNAYAMSQAVKAGLGLAGLPDYTVHDDPDIVRVLPDISGPPVDGYFVYAEELRHSKRIAVFRDFLIAQIADSNF